MPAVVGVHISGELPGAIKDYGSATLPFGFLICDGSALSRTAYAHLFSYIGTAYGDGDGSTTFNLPDCRGYFTRGWDNGAGNDPDSTGRSALNGGNTGDAVGSYQVSEFASHQHYVQYYQAGFATAGIDFLVAYDGSTPDSGEYTYAVGGSTETRPINVYVNKMIAYV